MQDLFYITILAAFMGYTHPRQELSRQKPLGRVLSPPVLLSTTLQLAVIIVFQTASLRALYRVPWYTRSLGTPDLRTIVAPETTTIYLMGLAQFLILALVFNKGHPHRMPLWTNLGLTLALVCQLGFLIYSTFAVDAFTTKVQQLVGFGPPLGLPVSFRGVLVLIFVLNAGAALGAEALCQLILMAVGGLRSKYGWFGGKKQQQQYAFSSSGSELPLPPPIESMGSGVPLRTPHALDGSNGGAYAGSTGGQASRRGVNGAAAAATGAAPQHNTALL
jgi:cation-transporting ATPase 13A3/4/5